MVGISSFLLCFLVLIGLRVDKTIKEQAHHHECNAEQTVVEETALQLLGIEDDKTSRDGQCNNYLAALEFIYSSEPASENNGQDLG